MTRHRLDNAFCDALEAYELGVSKRIKEGEKVDIDNLENEFSEWVEDMLSDFVDNVDWQEIKEQLKEGQ